MTDTNQPDPEAEPESAQYRLLPVRWFLAAYSLVVIIIALLPLLMQREFFIMILAIAPVIYAAFYYPSWVYRVMILNGLVLDILSAYLLARDFWGTLFFIVLVVVQVALLADLAYNLASSRTKTQLALKTNEGRYRSFVVRMRGIAFQQRLNRGSFTFVHGPVEEISGYTPEEFIQGRVRRETLTHPDDYALYKQQIEELYTTPNYVFDHEYRILKQDGRQRWVHEVSQLVCNPDGRPLCVQGTIFDVTQQKEIDEAQREGQVHFRSLFENTPVSLWDEDFSRIKTMVKELTAQGVGDLRDYFHKHPDELLRFTSAIVVNDVNRASLALLGFKTKKELFDNINRLLGRTISEAMVEEFCAIAEGRTYFQWEGINDVVNGQPRYQRITWSVAPGSEQSYKRVIVAIDDITDSKRTEEALLYLSSHDTLTGLYNRAFFDAEMERLKHGRSYPISVLFADMDGLKATNDSLGHAVGDELLRRAAAVLRDSFRGDDIVARIGGDEFGVLLPGLDADGARHAIGRVRKVLAAHNQIKPDQPPVQFSIGSATANPGDDLNAVLHEADEQMYKEKPTHRR